MVPGLLTQCFKFCVVLGHFVFCPFVILKVFVSFLGYSVQYCSLFPPLSLPTEMSLCVYLVVWVLVSCFPWWFIPSCLPMFPPAGHVCALPCVPSLPLVCLSSTPASCFPFYCEGPAFPCFFLSVLILLSWYDHSSQLCSPCARMSIIFVHYLICI